MSSAGVVSGQTAAAPVRRVPLAAAQRGIYVTQSLAPDSPVYIVPIALRVRGQLRPNALQAAVDTLWRRHQALRTTFEEVAGEPVQLVRAPELAPPVTVRWSSVEDAGPRTASAEAQRRARAPFDLARGPLWRVEVVALGPDEHALIFAFHHIIVDEVSASVLAREFRIAYAGRPELPEIEPGREYLDFCLSQQDRRDGEGLAYWREQLRGVAPRLLPQERTHAPGTLFHGERIRFNVEPSTVDLLGAFCVRRRVTAFMVFHASLAMLVHGWTGEQEVAIGTPMGARVEERFAETVGYFQNTVVLRATVAADQTFADLLSQSRRTVLQALRHQDTPFESVVESLRPARAATRNPLFQAALVYNRVKLEQEWVLDGLRVEPLPFDWPVAPFDLTLTLVQQADELGGDVTYDTSRFRRDTIEGLAATFVQLLPALLADPELTAARAPRPRRLAPESAAGAAAPGVGARAREQAGEQGGGAEAGEPTRAEILCELFREVLGVVDVRIHDNFFDLGGHSLLAGRLISRVRTVLDARVSLRDLFEAPTVAGLLARLLPAEAEATTPPHESPPREPPGASTQPSARASTPRLPRQVPLSPAQRGLWYLNRLEGPSPTYNIPLVLRFAEGVDPPILRAALLDVLTRHESLRTVFAEIDGEAWQVVVDPAECGFDLAVVAVAEADLDKHLRRTARHSFDLAAHIPLRAWLFALPSGEHVLHLLVHHIASDAWSLGPLGRDLALAYAARLACRPPAWPDLPVQYADYTLWRRERLGAVDDPTSLAARQLAYWREALAGLPEEIALPADRPRPPVASYRGGTIDVTWDGELHRALTRLARECDATLFMVLQAALAALLSRLGAGTDIPIGAPAGERGDEAFDGLVGYFVNTLVLRTDVRGDPTFRALVARVRHADLAAFAAQDVPFDQVVEAVNPGRSLSRQPLFQVMLTLYRDIGAQLRLPGVTTTLGQTHTGVSKFDLSVNLQEFYDVNGAPAGVQGVVEYATDLFDAATVRTMVSRLARLLRAVAADPDLRVAVVDLLDATERRVLLAGHGAVRDVPGARLPDLVERQAAATPDAIAVLHEDTSTSYHTLNARANQLARLLIASGVGPGRFVAVALPRGLDLVVALLAVLKAGGAYTPVELDQPPERIAFILDDVDPVLVLTDTAAAGRLPTSPSRPRVCVHNGVADGYPTRDITDAERIAPVSMADAAYAIFTSGSTGRPKAVVVEHRSLRLYLAYATWAYPSLAGHALVHSPVSFDLTVTGLFAPLTVGGCVHLASLDEHTARLLAAPVSFLKLTPSHLPILAGLPERCSPEGELVVGGEALLGSALRRWRRRHPATTVVNEYGPTETTVGCVEFRLRPGEPTPTGPLPIGRPIWNTQVHLLDADGQPVPVGVRGELYLAGGLLARGYLNRPGLTAERFLPNPYGAAGTRMYRTGDLGRWNGQGQLEYEGRTDSQVKVRGYRIELGEIEAALSAHQRVAESAVVARDGPAGDRRLVAYVVPAAQSTVDDEQLRAHLADRLPRHMLPSVFVRLRALPRSAHGKIDRRALPAPDLDARPRGRPPRTPTEKALGRLFAQVLGLARVGVDESFFDLGGHSLLAVRLVARIRRQLGWPVPVGTLIAQPTVAALARGLDGDTHLGAPTPLVRLRASVRPAPPTTVVLIHPVGGTLFCYRRLVRELPDEVAVVGCERLHGDHPTEESLWDVIDRHADALNTAVPEGALVLAGWSVGGVLAHAVAGRLVAAGRSVPRVALLDSLAVRAPGDRALIRSQADRLVALAEAARQEGSGVLTQPRVERLLGEYGLDATLLGRTPIDEVAEMMADWAGLLALLAAHEPATVAVAARLFIASDNPGRLPDRIVASWSGLCAELTVRSIPGDHLTILRSPGLASEILGELPASLVPAVGLEATCRE